MENNTLLDSKKKSSEQRKRRNKLKSRLRIKEFRSKSGSYNEFSFVSLSHFDNNILGEQWERYQFVSEFIRNLEKDGGQKIRIFLLLSLPNI